MYCISPTLMYSDSSSCHLPVPGPTRPFHAGLVSVVTPTCVPPNCTLLLCCCWQLQSALGLEHPSPAALSALQARQQQLDRQRHDAQVELTTLKAEAVELRAALAEAEASAASSTGELHALRSALSAAQLELRLVRSEADGLRRLVLLLEQEQNNGGTETSTAVLGDTKVTPAVPNDGVAPMDASDGGAAATSMPTDSAAAAARAAALESLVAELQAAREQLQTQLADATQAEAELRGAEAAAQVELRKRERELESMAAAVDALQASTRAGQLQRPAGK